MQAQLVSEAQQLQASVLLHDPRGRQPFKAEAEAAAAEVAEWSIDQWWQVPELLRDMLPQLCHDAQQSYAWYGGVADHHYAACRLLWMAMCTFTDLAAQRAAFGFAVLQLLEAAHLSREQQHSLLQHRLAYLHTKAQLVHRADQFKVGFRHSSPSAWCNMPLI